MNDINGISLEKVKPLPKHQKSINRAVVFALMSIIFNTIIALGKFILSIFKGVFFFVSGCINIFWLISKLECSLALKNKFNKSAEHRNKMIALFLLLAGLEYTIYMLALIFWERKTMQYGSILSISIATVSFYELGVAIYGLCKTKGKGGFYRNIKIVNFCTALTAIIWAEVALLSFTNRSNANIVCGISGAVVGLVIIAFAVYIYFSKINETKSNYVLKNKT